MGQYNYMRQYADNVCSKLARLVVRRWFVVIMALIAVFGLIIILLPYGIRYAGQRWLVGHGASEAQIQHVAFNPFTGRMSLQGIQATIGDKRVLNFRHIFLDLRWLPLWHKHVALRQLTVNGSNIDVEQLSQGGLKIAGLTFPKTSSGWGFGAVRLQINNGEIHYISSKINTNIKINRLDLADFATWRPARPSHMDFQGTIGEGQLQLSGEVLPFASTPRFYGHLKLVNLSLHTFAPLVKTEITDLHGRINLDADVAAEKQTSGASFFHESGDMFLHHFVVSTKAGGLSDEQITWNGTIGIAVPAMPAKPNLFANGELKSVNLAVRAPNQKFQVKNKIAQWSGDLGYGQGNSSPGYSANGNLNVKGLSINDVADHLKLLQMQELQLKNIQINGLHHIAVAQANLDQLRIGQTITSRNKTSLPPILKTAQAKVHVIKTTDFRKWTIGSVQIQDTAGFVRRKKNKRWYLLSNLSTMVGGSKVEKARRPRQSIAISSLQVSGDSSLRFEDDSVSPAFSTTLQVEKLQLSELDSTKPKKPTPIKLNAHIGHYSQVNLAGSVKPFVSGLSMDLTGKFHRLNLPSLSSYTVPILGYNITSGHLDSDIKLKVVKGKLNDVNHLAFSDLQVSAVNTAQADQLKSQLNMPLKSVLDLLRDSNDNIKVTVPVTGNLNAPDFHLGNVIDQALGNAIKLAAVDYVKYALQPYGAIILLAQFAHHEATEVHLTPVAFEPGDATLDSTAKEYMARLGTLLKDRPHLRVRFCGQATRIDRSVLNQRMAVRNQRSNTTTALNTQSNPVSVSDRQLDNLAAARARAIENHLVNHYGITPDRLFICKPAIDNQPNAQPEVKLEL
jgi:hypothetical protein